MSKQKSPTTTRVFDDVLFKLEIEPIIEAWDVNGDAEILESQPITLTAVDDPNDFMFDTVTLYSRKMRNFAEQFEGIYRRIWRESVGPETPEFIDKELRPRLLAAIEQRAQATRDRWSRIRFHRGGNEHALMRFEPELLKLEKEIKRQLTIEARRLSLRAGDDPQKPTARDSDDIALPGTWEELRRRGSISQRETAAFLRCDPQTIRRRVKSKELKQSAKSRIVCDDLLRIQIRKVHGQQVFR